MLVNDFKSIGSIDLYIDVINDNSDEFNLGTFTHELGHGLGLSHPGEQPNNPLYNTVEDSIMSYNSFNGQWGTEFTENDYDALEMIWGSETT